MSAGFVILLVVLAVLVIAAWASNKLLSREIVSETEFVLLYREGIFQRLLDPGGYWIMPMRDGLVRIDKRPRDEVLSGQEILTKDRIAIKISLVIAYEATDPRKIHDGSQSATWSLLEAARLALREVVVEMTLDETLEARSDLGARVRSALEARSEELGFALNGVAVRDVMLPNNLKRAYAGVLEAQKEAERRLEQARGEQAVVRSLANTARMLGENPALVQARMLQALDTGGNTLVFGSTDLATLTQKGPDSPGG